MEELRQKIERLVQAQAGSGASVAEVRPLVGGACQDNYRVELVLEGQKQRSVLRSDAIRRLPGSLDRRQEFEVITRAVKGGVKTPAARWTSEGLLRDGAHAYFLDWVEGEAIGRRVVKSPELAKARETLATELAEVLAKIHAITPESSAGLTLPGGEAKPAAFALAQLRQMMDQMKEAHPALELAFRWLSDHATAEEERTLVHGDFRTGNFMVTPSGLTAVLDWEFAHFGNPYEDLSWISVRDWRFGELQKPIGGFAARDAFYAAYEKASGRKVDPKQVRYWEVMGNVRWAVGSVYQGERYLSGEETDLELIAIARRAAEMEFEALRLIGRAG